MEQTATIIINWNGWKDTIECLSSFKQPPDNLHFFIVDNASSNNSVGQLEIFLKTSPFAYKLYSISEFEQNFDKTKNVSLIQNDKNVGFAGGTNMILKFLLNHGFYSYAWLLNNDTIVTGETLTHLQNGLSQNNKNAFCGSVILDYYKPELVQCCGVNHYKYLGISKLFLKNQIWDSIKSSNRLKNAHQDYQNGASLLVDLDKVTDIGLMDEIFFLYSEEADWQFRAKRKGLSNVLSLKSIIYHKGSMSTSGKKDIFFYNYNRSAILLTRKNFGGIASLTSTLSLIVITMVRSKFSYKSFVAGIKGIYAGWKINIK